MKELEIVLAHPSLKIIDVRTPFEFLCGSISGDVNIAISKLQHSVKVLNTSAIPIVLRCALGVRSYQAKQISKLMGLENIHNVGSWHTVNNLVNTA